MTQYDTFADIINQSDGIFGSTEPNIAGHSGGLHDFDSTKTQVTQKGVAVEMHCRGCPRPVRLTVEFPELVAIKYNVNPEEVFKVHPGIVQDVTSWTYNPTQNAWWTNVRCTCGNLVAPMFTPEEAEQQLKTARYKGWINTQGEEYVSRLAYEMGKRLAPAGR